MRVAKNWKKVAQRDMSPSFEIFKIHLDMDLGNLLCVALYEQGGSDQTTSMEWREPPDFGAVDTQVWRSR